MATSNTGFDLTPLSADRVTALAKDLSPEERHVILDHGTERPGCGVFLDNKKSGTYTCRLCALPLFTSKAKFESGTGWPSFTEPLTDGVIAYHVDRSHGMVRVETECNVCDAHLGHVFPDGPPPTGLRFCMNAAALRKLDDTH